VVPAGIHKNEVLPHSMAAATIRPCTFPEIDVPYDTSAGVPVPLKAGGMTFHHCRTLHYAGPNLTNGMRRAWANEYQTAPVRRAAPANRPWVDAGKKALIEGMARRT
jgi:ectoine hydroxylase-related dioxygenase (phytanoyl-CoA dioxygenase family)